MSKTTQNNGAAGMAIAVIVSIAVGAFGGYMIGTRRGQAAASLNEAAVATVNGTKITKSAIYDRMVAKGGAQLVDRMIDETLVDNAAKEKNITVSQKEIDDEMARLKERLGGDEQFQMALAQYQLTEEEVRQDQVMRVKLKKILLPDITVDEEALKKYFEDNKAQFGGEDQVKARHILVATEEEAKAIKAELDKGADFATLAKEKSTEPAAKESGGDLGTFGKGRMVPEFEAVVFALKKDEISNPFKTEFGWHVAQVQELIPAKTYDQVKDTVKEAYIDDQVAERTQTWLVEQRQKAKIDNTLEAAQS